MATHSVNVLIKARDEASKKFGVIGVSSKVMGTALKATARSIRWSFTRAFAGISASAKLAFRGITAMARKALNTIKTTLKRIAQGIAAAFAYSTYAAMRQEQAVLALEGALRGLGKYSEAVMEDFKQFASAMQKATTYGDEYVLELLSIASAQTETSEAAKKLVSDTLALIKIVPAGRMKPVAFLKMVLGFKMGLKDLDTYIIALKGVTDETERQRIYNEKLAVAWGIWGKIIESTSGSLKQMWNAIGDAAEAFGKPFLDDITRSAKAIKKWSEDNQDAIALFAEKVHSAMTLVKDLFGSFFDFMKKDWRTGFSFVFDSFLKLLEATFEAAVILAIAGGKGIWRGVEEGLLAGRDRKIMAEAMKRYKEAGGEVAKGKKESRGGFIGGYMFGVTPPTDKEEFERIRKQVESEFLQQQTKNILGESLGAAASVFKDAVDKIAKDVPANLMREWKKDMRDSKDRLAALLKPEEPGKPAPGKPEPGKEEPETAAGNLIAALRQQLQAREARLLTAAPGTRYDYAQQTARNTKQSLSRHDKLVRLQEKTIVAIDKIGRNSGPNLSPANFS